MDTTATPSAEAKPTPQKLLPATPAHFKDLAAKLPAEAPLRAMLEDFAETAGFMVSHVQATADHYGEIGTPKDPAKGDCAVIAICHAEQALSMELQAQISQMSAANKHFADLGDYEEMADAATTGCYAMFTLARAITFLVGLWHAQIAYHGVTEAQAEHAKDHSLLNPALRVFAALAAALTKVDTETGEATDPAGNPVDLKRAVDDAKTGDFDPDFEVAVQTRTLN